MIILERYGVVVSKKAYDRYGSYNPEHTFIESFVYEFDGGKDIIRLHESRIIKEPLFMVSYNNETKAASLGITIEQLYEIFDFIKAHHNLNQ